MAAFPEFYDGTNWISLLTGSIIGTANEIAVTQDNVTQQYTISFENAPTIPGGATIDGATTVDNGDLTVSTGDVTLTSGNLTVAGTGFLQLPAGTTAERPTTPIVGMVRFNTDNV